MAKKKKIITLDELARRMERGFQVTASKSDVTQLIEDLARIVKLGFDDTASKQELGALRHRMEVGFSAVADEFNLVRGDLRELKLTRDIISRAVAGEIAEIRNRVSRIERKVGLAK